MITRILKNIRPTYYKIVYTFLTQLINMILFLYLYYLIGKEFGPDGLGEFSIVKRVVSLLLPILLLGLGIGLPRYVALSNNIEERNSYLKVSSFSVIFTFFVILIILIFKHFFSILFFGSIQHQYLIIPILIWLSGFVIHCLVYSYFRGLLNTRAFNFLEVINLGLVPILILIGSNKISISEFILFIGTSNIIIAFIFLFIFSDELFKKTKTRILSNSAKRIYFYSLQRIPASFLFAGFFSIGPIIATHFTSVEEAGYLSISQSLLTMTGGFVAPLGLILLPKISSMINEKRHDEIKENLNCLIGGTIQLSVFISCQLILFSDIIIVYWLGDNFLNAITTLKICSFSIYFFLIYKVLASILDATSNIAINTINLCISFVIFLASAGLLVYVIRITTPINSVCLAFVIGLISLGSLTYLSIRKIYSKKYRTDLSYFFWALVLNLLIVYISIIIKPYIISNMFFIIAYEVIAFIVYIYILFLIKTYWLRQLPILIFKNKMN